MAKRTDLGMAAAGTSAPFVHASWSLWLLLNLRSALLSP